MGLKLVGRTQIAHSATSLARRIGVISFGLALGQRHYRSIALPARATSADRAGGS